LPLEVSFRFVQNPSLRIALQETAGQSASKPYLFLQGSSGSDVPEGGDGDDALFGDVLPGEELLGDALLGDALLGEALLGDALLGDALLGDSLDCTTLPSVVPGTLMEEEPD